MPFVLDDLIDKFWSDGRINELEQVAAENGFKFLKRQRMADQPYEIKDFRLFRGKKAKRFRGVLSRRANEIAVKVRIYDYVYYAESRKRKSTVLELYHPRLDLPRFAVMPKRGIKWIQEMFSSGKPPHPELLGFHSYYEILGDDMEDIRESLTEEFMDLISTKTRIRCEGEGRYLLLYYRDRKIPAKHIMPEYDFLLQAADALTEDIAEEDLV